MHFYLLTTLEDCLMLLSVNSWLILNCQSAPDNSQPAFDAPVLMNLL